MCKGDELEKWLASNGGLEAFEKVVYVGDGGNDFCPLLRMRKWVSAPLSLFLSPGVPHES